MLDILKTWRQSAQANPAIEAAAAVYSHDPVHYAKITASLMPVLGMLTSGSLREEYSGKSIAQPVVTVTEGSLLPGHTVTVDVFTGLKYVGKADNVFEGVRILDEDGNNVTALYAVERAYGTLQLDSRPLVITTGSASKEYDGSPLSCMNYTAEGLAEGDQIEIGFAEYTLRGTYQNAITSLRIVNEDGEDVTRNYTIEAVYGTLRVY